MVSTGELVVDRQKDEKRILKHIKTVKRIVRASSLDMPVKAKLVGLSMQMEEAITKSK